MMKNETSPPNVVIVGAGFAGLSAALEFAEAGIPVTVIEQDKEVGGLAGTFDVNGHKLEKFYHHWFTNDAYIMQMVEKLNLQKNILLRPTRTGMYFANQFFRLSSPLDVLKFTPLSLLDRIRLGLLVFQVRSVKNWRKLESLTVKEWLIKLCGKKVYEIVWEPLLLGKFGPYAEDISAVWYWKKLVLRGSSRSKTGAEMLAYYQGGFAALAESIATEITNKGGVIKLNTKVIDLITTNNKISGVRIAEGEIPADIVISTTALPITANFSESHLPAIYVSKLRRIKYLANLCLVLELDRSLSKTYWLNVNDPSFPFVGVIEHTNFEPPQSYGGSHIVYLSKYLPASDALYTLPKEDVLAFALPHVKRMFPQFDEKWIKGFHVWHADYAQPIVEKYYSNMVPSAETPIENFYLCTMAQIYPEDRGTNYAIREGQTIAKKIIEQSMC